MKKLYKLILVSIGLMFYLSQTVSTANAATCNWKSRYAYPSFWDSCSGYSNKYSVNGVIYYKSSSSCFKYEWTVNGKNAGTSNIMSFPITANGTYTVCVKVKDTCNSCDTTYCSTRTITCVNNCNWKALNATTNYWDTCSSTSAGKKYSLNGSIAFKTGSCLTYSWSVNGSKAGFSNVMNYKITANGTYKICVQVYDSCNKCDTSYCTTRTITCITCNWKGNGNMSYYYQYMSDSCPKKYYYGGVGLKSTKGISITWKSNGNVIGTGATYKYTPSKAGYYSICAVLYDSTNRCDTTLCKTFYYNCVGCNWKSRKPYFYTKDSCDSRTFFMSAYVTFNTSSTSCYKYDWTMNGTSVSKYYYMNKTTNANGTYTFCVKVTDTCNNCDTTFCITKTVTCIKGATCNWASRKPASGYWDSCAGKKNKYSLNAYLLYTSYYYKGCLKYQWTVNGNKAGNGDYMNSYPITANGNYTICVKVTDTCNNCDTTYCTTRNITCVSGSSKCNWKSRNAYIWTNDTCDKKYNVNYMEGLIYFKYTGSTCLKYQWFINGTAVSSSDYFKNTLTKNGSYSVCVKVTDTCNNCDTTYCTSRSVTCISGSKCNWKSRKPYLYGTDSCDTKYNSYFLRSNISFNYSTKCFKYQWTVNGSTVSNSYGFSYIVYKNGTYVVCLKVTDTCNNCDTSFCMSKTVTCLGGSKCNWRSGGPSLTLWDSCDTRYNQAHIFTEVYFTSAKASCFKYKWTVNGTPFYGNYQYSMYKASTNGTYTLCVNVKDTCNNCDTTFCISKTVTCLGGSKCNWKSGGPSFSTYDSCDSRSNTAYLYGDISFKSVKTNCFKYKWTVNGSAQSGNYSSFGYFATSNGSYTICVNVKDTCNNCDTTFCFTKTVSCLKGSKCNWKDRKPAIGYWDSCSGKKNKYSLNAYSMFTNYYYKSCLKYQWTVNGNKAGNTDWMTYPITANGTYTICVKVSDTCNNCDTTYCTTRTITCVGTTKCNWKSRSAGYYSWDSCTSSTKSSIYGYIYFSSKSCLKYQWMVNGSKAGNGTTMNYSVTANGKYSVCVTVTDTCNKCDTTYCSSTTISCIKGSKCNWNSQLPYIAYWDSCSGRKNKYSLNAYIYFTKSGSCHSYQWTVNGKNAGNGAMMSYPVSGNGTYSVCLKTTDTCNKCDTTFCTYRVFKCSSTKCNWKSKNAYLITKDTCITSIKNYSVNGAIYLPGSSTCYTYQWTVNSANAGTNQYMNYSITKNGTYSVCVTVKDTCNNCDTTYCSYVKVNCVPAGINKIVDNGLLKVYPNPTGGMVKVDWAEGNSSYCIMNANGQILQTGILENGVNTLDLNKYSTGLYMIQVRTQNAILTEKISVQKR